MARTEPIQLPLSKLQTGITVKLPLSWKNHPFLFNRIKIEEEAQIELIKSLGVPYVLLVSGEELLEEESEEGDEQAEKAEEVVDPIVEAKRNVRDRKSVV